MLHQICTIVNIKNLKDTGHPSFECVNHAPNIIYRLNTLAQAYVH